MANTRAGNVIRLDTTGTVPGPSGRIKSILYVGDTGASAILRADGGSSQIVWQRSGDLEALDEVCIVLPGSTNNLHITVANGAVVYLYTA